MSERRSVTTGILVAGRYRVEERVGAGGMGVVFRARDERLGRDVALKIVSSKHGDSAVRRLRREARAVASLDHSGIATLFDVVDAPDLGLVLVMELVRGETLRALVARGARPPREAARIVLDIAESLGAAHRAGLVHRDVKPDNVIVRPDGRVVLLDFGIAKAMTERGAEAAEVSPMAVTGDTTEGLVVGTPAYLAPEQAMASAEITGAADQFALAVVAFELLTGESPWRSAANGPALMAQIVGAEAPKPSAMRPELGAEVDQVLEQALRKKPSERFATVEAFAQALVAAVAVARVVEMARESEARKADELPFAKTELAPVSKRRSRVPLVGGAFVVSVATAATVVAIAVAMRTRPTALAAASLAMPPSSVAAHAVTDFPPPQTNVPEAAAAYASAVRNLRNGALELASGDLVHAVKLDPTLAAAHVRLAVYPAAWGGTPGSGFDFTPTQMREALAAATRFKAKLAPRDLALLVVAESLLADPPRFDDALERARAARAQLPDDAEVALILANVLPRVDRMDEARDTYRAALTLDPEYATALAYLGYWAAEMQDFDGAAADFDRCLAIVATASTCLLRRANLHEARGDCAAFEADARRLTQMEPTMPRAYEYLARALAAEGAPIESVRAALDRVVDLGAGASPIYTRSFERFSLATLVGDFPEAIAAAREGDRELAAHPDEGIHALVADALSAIAKDMGDTAEAKRVHDEFTRRSGAWTLDAPYMRERHLVDLHRGGRLSDADFVAQRDSLYADNVARWAPPSGSISADLIWLNHYALPTPETPWETADFLAHVKARGRVYDEWAGLAGGYIAAKDYADAIPSLRRSTHRCTVLPESVWSFTATTLWWLMRERLLGEALEATGDVAGACAAYAVVIDRWKGARPRSITLERARAASARLECTSSAR
jgi:serine/threonine-protein kinase